MRYRQVRLFLWVIGCGAILATSLPLHAGEPPLFRPTGAIYTTDPDRPGELDVRRPYMKSQRLRRLGPVAARVPDAREAAPPPAVTAPPPSSSPTVTGAPKAQPAGQSIADFLESQD